MDHNFFNSMEKKTGVKMADILQLANSLQNANFKDEKTVRNVIQQVSEIANRPVPKEMEEQLVNSIINDGEKLDMNKLMSLVNTEKEKGKEKDNT